MPDLVANPAKSLPALPAPTREQIERFEARLLAMPQREIELVHWIHAGQYYRQITIPADTYCTGAVHLQDHVSVMISGEMDALTERGMENVSGFHAWAAKAGTKRVGYAVKDTVWLTVDRTDALSVEEAEMTLFEAAPMLLSNRGVAPLELAQ